MWGAPLPILGSFPAASANLLHLSSKAAKHPDSFITKLAFCRVSLGFFRRRKNASHPSAWLLLSATFETLPVLSGVSDLGLGSLLLLICLFFLEREREAQNPSSPERQQSDQKGGGFLL